MEVRTRFAPSPTGFLHVGGVRSALYPYLLARKHGGKFILRIEDTDQQRLVPGAIRCILEDLAWFGIEIDEGPGRAELERVNDAWPEAPELGGPVAPYIQSLRLSRYQEIAEQLVSSGHAFRCDCTPEMIEAEREAQSARKELPGYGGRCRNREVPRDSKHVVRFKMPSDRTVVLDDAVKGRVVWETVPMRDPVLLKSDGFPTYHLAVVCDDHDMRVSHVMRGDEWLSSAPLHVLLYEALGWQMPTFAHLSKILGASGKKLSKRDGAVSCSHFREQGYLPEALLNFIALIGWSPKDAGDQEIFTKDEMVPRFSLEQLNAADGVFDYDKLLWMNGLYLRKLTLDDFVSRVRPFFERAGVAFEEQLFRPLAPHVQERAKTLAEVPGMVDFLFESEIERELPAMFQKGIDREKALAVLGAAIEAISAMPEFGVASSEAALREIATRLGLKAGPAFGVIRIAVTGKTVSPPLFESMAALGRERSLERLRQTAAILESQGEQVA